MKCSSEQDVHLLVRFSCMSSLNSCSTFSVSLVRASSFGLCGMVHKCGYFWNIFLDIFWCVLDMLSNWFSTLLCFGDTAKCSTSLYITSLPTMLIVLMSNSSIVQFFALDDPHWMSTWIVLCTLMLLLLKHLTSPIDFSGRFIFVVLFTSRFCAVYMFMKLIGLPVSTSQYVCLIFVFV